MAYAEQLPSGNFRGIATWKDCEGKKRRKSFTDPSERRALRLAENYEEKIRAKHPSGKTILQAMNEYIDAFRPVLSPSTIHCYKAVRDSLRKNCLKYCEKYELPKADSQALIADMVGQGFASKTIKNYFSLISAACKHASVPYERPKFPPWNLQDAIPPSEEDMKKILNEVRGTKLELPVLLGMFGLRRSEIAGLSPDDLRGNILYIHAAKVNGENGLPVLKPATKTSQSTRTIQLPDDIANKFRKSGGVHMTPNAISRAFMTVSKRLGLNVPFKSLRSFFASYCHNVLHLSDAQIQKLGGWSKTTTLHRHYIRTMNDQDAANTVSAALDNIWNSPRQSPRSEKR